MAASTDKHQLYADQNTRPAMLHPLWDVVPQSLRSIARWIAWGLHFVNGRWTKVPLNVNDVSLSGFGKASTTDGWTWAPFEQVKTRLKNPSFVNEYDGIGFVFSKDDNNFGIDIDNCRCRHTGELSDLAQYLIAQFGGYWEVSPSQTGIKGFHRGKLPKELKWNKSKWQQGQQLPDSQEIEVYNSGRYFAITGYRIESCTEDIVECQQESLNKFFNDFTPVGNKEESIKVRSKTVLPGLGRLTDEQIIKWVTQKAKNAAEGVSSGGRVYHFRGDGPC